MKVIEKLSDAGSACNEDQVVISEKYAVMMDGISGLCPEIMPKAVKKTGETDAAWLARQFASALQQGLDNIGMRKIEDVLRDAIIKVGHAFMASAVEEIEPEFKPAATLAIALERDGKLEVYTLGDIAVIIERNDSNIVIHDDRVCKLDEKAKMYIAEEANRNGVDYLEAVRLPECQEKLIENRRKRNGGQPAQNTYGVLSMDTGCLQYASFAVYDLDGINNVFMASDGFLEYCEENSGDRSYDIDDLVSEYYRRGSLHSMLIDLRDVQDSDPRCIRYHRFKRSDDATAVLLSFKRSKEKEKKIAAVYAKWLRIKQKAELSLMTFDMYREVAVALIKSIVAFLATWLLILADTGFAKFSNVHGAYWLLLIGFFVVIIGFTMHRNYKRLERGIYSFGDPEKEALLNELQLAPSLNESGYSVREFVTPGKIERYVMSDAINGQLQEADRYGYMNYKAKFQIPDEVKILVPHIMNRRLLKKNMIFNGRLVQQLSDLRLDRKSAEVALAGYFDYQCTNEIAYRCYVSKTDMGYSFHGADLVFTDNVLRPLEETYCADIIGISTLVITKNRRIIIGCQAETSMANPSRFAPSGSGSMDYKDIKSCGSDDFLDLLSYAMKREFCEEFNQSIFSHLKTKVIGYARLMERGGKPDYFGISYLDEEVTATPDIRHSELLYADNSIMLSFDSVDEIPHVLRRFCDFSVKNSSLSIQIEIFTCILEKMQAEGTLRDAVEGLME